eukprot:scaffold2071_cov93-Cylindrotheca_fusiformis.AAC.1
MNVLKRSSDGNVSPSPTTTPRRMKKRLSLGSFCSSNMASPLASSSWKSPLLVSNDKDPAVGSKGSTSASKKKKSDADSSSLPRPPLTRSANNSSSCRSLQTRRHLVLKDKQLLYEWEQNDKKVILRLCLRPGGNAAPEKEEEDKDDDNSSGDNVFCIISNDFLQVGCRNGERLPPTWFLSHGTGGLVDHVKSKWALKKKKTWVVVTLFKQEPGKIWRFPLFDDRPNDVKTLLKRPSRDHSSSSKKRRSSSSSVSRRRTSAPQQQNRKGALDRKIQSNSRQHRMASSSSSLSSPRSSPRNLRRQDLQRELKSFQVAMDKKINKDKKKAKKKKKNSSNNTAASTASNNSRSPTKSKRRSSSTATRTISSTPLSIVIRQLEKEWEQQWKDQQAARSSPGSNTTSSTRRASLSVKEFYEREWKQKPPAPYDMVKTTIPPPPPLPPRDSPSTIMSIEEINQVIQDELSRQEHQREESKQELNDDDDLEDWPSVTATVEEEEDPEFVRELEISFSTWNCLLSA